MKKTFFIVFLLLQLAFMLLFFTPLHFISESWSKPILDSSMPLGFRLSKEVSESCKFGSIFQPIYKIDWSVFMAFLSVVVYFSMLLASSISYFFSKEDKSMLWNEGSLDNINSSSPQKTKKEDVSLVRHIKARFISFVYYIIIGIFLFLALILPYFSLERPIPGGYYYTPISNAWFPCIFLAFIVALGLYTFFQPEKNWPLHYVNSEKAIFSKLLFSLPLVVIFFGLSVSWRVLLYDTTSFLRKIILDISEIGNAIYLILLSYILLSLTFLITETRQTIWEFAFGLKPNL